MENTFRHRWRAGGALKGGQDSCLPLANDLGCPPKHRGFLTPHEELMDPNKVLCLCYCSAAWKHAHKQH